MRKRNKMILHNTKRRVFPHWVSAIATLLSCIAILRTIIEVMWIMKI